VLSSYSKENGWIYIKALWFNDQLYEKSMKWRKKMTGIDYTLKEYRIDQIKILDAERVILALQEAKRFAMRFEH